MILLWLLKIKSVITSVITFIVKNWQVFAVLAMALAIFYYKTAYEREKHAYEVHLLADMKAYEVRQAENKVKEERHAKDVAVLVDTHNKELEAIKNEYLKRTKKDSITIADLRNKLREQLATDTTTGLPNFESDTETNPEIWREHYTTLARQYQTLVDACTITTSDFNALRAWADSSCEVVECK